MEQSDRNDVIRLAVTLKQPSNFEGMGDEWRTVDLPMLTRMA